jgi:hypothetical protein
MGVREQLPVRHEPAVDEVVALDPCEGESPGEIGMSVSTVPTRGVQEGTYLPFGVLGLLDVFRVDEESGCSGFPAAPCARTA